MAAELLMYWILALVPNAQPADLVDDEKYLQRTASSCTEDLLQASAAKRRAAAFALGKLGVHALPHLPRLRQVVQQDPDASVRIAVANALGELGVFSASEDVPVLITVVEKDKSIAVQRAAIMALGKLGDR